jgi:hypothetical protein
MSTRLAPAACSRMRAASALASCFGVFAGMTTDFTSTFVLA